MTLAEITRGLAARHLLGFVESVAREHHVTVNEVLGRGRTKRVMTARVAVYRGIRALGFSANEVALLMGREQSTIFKALAREAGR